MPSLIGLSRPRSTSMHRAPPGARTTPLRSLILLRMETGAGATEEAEVARTCLGVGAWSKVTLALTAAGGAEDEEEAVAGSTRELAMPAFPLLKGVNALLSQSSKTLTATNRHILGG